MNLNYMLLQVDLKLHILPPSSVTKPPTLEEINILRNRVDPMNVRKLEILSGKERIPR